MAVQAQQAAIGLEISEDYIVISQVIQSPEGPLITQILSETLPPRTINNGDIINPDVLAETITSALSSIRAKTSNMVVALDDSQFYKQVDKIMKAQLEDIHKLVDDRLFSTQVFSRKPFQSGFQIPEGAPTDTNKYAPVLFAAIAQEKVMAIRDVVEMIGFNLVAIDLVPLAITRAMNWHSDLEDQTYISVLLENQFIDFNVIAKGEVVFTRTVHHPLVDTPRNMVLSEELTQKLNHFIYSYYNQYPKSALLTKLLLSSRLSDTEWFEQVIAKGFPDLEVLQYDPRSNLKIAIKGMDETSVGPLLVKGLPAIGLGLKYFERLNKTLSLTKVRKQIGPIINRFQLVANGLLLVLAIFLFMGFGFFMDSKIKNMDSQIMEIRIQLKKLQTGEFLVGQKQLDSLIDRLGKYEKLEKGSSAVNFLKSVSDNLPTDMVIDSMDIKDDGMVSMRARCYSQKSINNYYMFLMETFGNVELKGISLDHSRGNIPMNHFNFQFKWSRD